jgi:hypothetical protein
VRSAREPGLSTTRSRRETCEDGCRLLDQVPFTVRLFAARNSEPRLLCDRANPFRSHAFGIIWRRRARFRANWHGFLVRRLASGPSHRQRRAIRRSRFHRSPSQPALRHRPSRDEPGDRSRGCRPHQRPRSLRRGQDTGSVSGRRQSSWHNQGRSCTGPDRANRLQQQPRLHDDRLAIAAAYLTAINPIRELRDLPNKRDGRRGEPRRPRNAN